MTPPQARQAGGASSAGTITLLNVEFNSSCNLRCAWCSLDHSKPRQIMTPQTLTRIMECVQAGQLPSLKRIDLHNGGETLLHPGLADMLTVIRRFRPGLPSGLRIGLLTNAMLLTAKTADQILRSNALDELRFSVDGGSPVLYERIRQGAKWDIVSRNILHFLSKNKHSRRPLCTEIICILSPEAGLDHALNPEFAHLLSKVSRVRLRHPHNWDGSVDLGVNDTSYRSIAATRSGEACFLLRKNLVVLPDGRVTVCCNDLNARGVIGSVLTHSLVELAANPARLEMLHLFKNGRKKDIPLCRDCSGFYSAPHTGGSFQERLDNPAEKTTTAVDSRPAFP